MNACIVVTTRCNFSCPDCLARGDAADDMTLDDLWQICRYYRSECKFPRFTITGGEPTLWKPLLAAIKMLGSSSIAESIKVITNGYHRNAWDYGGADIVQVSNYGCINQGDIVRLKEQLGKRLRVANPTHVRPEPVDTVSCTSQHLTYYRHRVYPCAAAWRISPECGRPIGEPVSAIDSAWCQACEHNRDAIPPHKTIVELRVLDSRITYHLRLPHMASLRQRYRKWLQKDVELYNGEPG